MSPIAPPSPQAAAKAAGGRPVGKMIVHDAGLERQGAERPAALARLLDGAQIFLAFAAAPESSGAGHGHFL